MTIAACIRVGMTAGAVELGPHAKRQRLDRDTVVDGLSTLAGLGASGGITGLQTMVTLSDDVEMTAAADSKAEDPDADGAMEALSQSAPLSQPTASQLSQGAASTTQLVIPKLTLGTLDRYTGDGRLSKTA